MPNDTNNNANANEARRRGRPPDTIEGLREHRRVLADALDKADAAAEVAARKVEQVQRERDQALAAVRAMAALLMGVK